MLVPLREARGMSTAMALGVSTFNGAVTAHTGRPGEMKKVLMRG